MDNGATVLGRADEWLRDIAISAAFSVWMAVLGPFGLFRLGPVELRIAFALSLILAFVLVYGLAWRLAVYGGRRFGISPWICAPLAYVMVTWPMSRLVAAFTVLFFPQIRYPAPALDAYLRLLIIQLPVVFAYLTAMYVLERRAQAAAVSGAAERTGPPAPSSRLAARLSGHLRGEIVALQAEDHYVRVHTAGGSALLLMRMSDAIGELDGLPGLRVHRSWWVARSAIRVVIATGRKTTLKLSNGAEAPVARDAAPGVRQLVAA